MKYLILITLLFSCSLGDNPDLVTKAGSLPLLKNQNNIGTIIGFNPSYPQATLDSFELAWRELVDAGMSVGRIQIDWEEIETEEGVYDKSSFENALIDLKEDGLQPFMTLSVYDSEGPGLPSFLEGQKLDDKEVLSRFDKLMDWVVPMLISYDGWGMVIGNEPDNFFEEDKKLDEEIIAFAKSSIAHIHTINENMAVSITMNIENLKESKKEMKKLLKECDFASINIYGSGLFPLDKPFTNAENENNFEEMLDFANGKQIVIQELGMHADETLLNSSEAIQNAFFEQFFQFMEQEDQVRAAFQFTLIDWSDEVLEIFNSVYEEETPQWFIDQYGEVLKSLGLINFDTGEKRLAYNAFIEWSKTFDEN